MLELTGVGGGEFRRVNPKWTGYHGAHRGPGWGQTRPHYWPIAADRWGLNWKNQVYEEIPVYDVSPRYRGRRFWEQAQIGAAPAVHLERARERAQLRTRLPLHSTRPATGNWLEFLTGAAPDCGPLPGGTSPGLTWSVQTVKPGGRGGFGRGRRGRTSDEKTSKWPFKRHFSRSCQKFKKIRKTFLQE